MLFRALAFVLVLLAVSLVPRAGCVRQGLAPDFRPAKPPRTSRAPGSICVRRRRPIRNRRAAPDWVEAVTIIPSEAKEGVATQDRVSDSSVAAAERIFRSCSFACFLTTSRSKQPQLVAWDESGTQVLQSGPLGAGRRLADIGKRDGADGGRFHHRRGSSRRWEDDSRRLSGLDGHG